MINKIRLYINKYSIIFFKYPVPYIYNLTDAINTNSLETGSYAYTIIISFNFITVTMYRRFICLSLERQNSEAVFTTTAIPSTFCIYEGQTFQAGDTFSTIDGCNSCNCTFDGEVKCTQRRCPLNIGKLVTVVIISVVVKILKRYSFVNIY